MPRNKLCWVAAQTQILGDKGLRFLLDEFLKSWLKAANLSHGLFYQVVFFCLYSLI